MARWTSLRTFADRASARTSSCAASSRAARWYCGIANGVSGASAFWRGRVAIHAVTAGANSARKRRR